MKQLGKRIYNNDFFKYWGGRPPFYSDLSFYSKDRTGEVVNNKIDDTVNGELVGRKYGKFITNTSAKHTILGDISGDWSKTCIVSARTLSSPSGLFGNVLTGITAPEVGIGLFWGGASLGFVIKYNDTSYILYYTGTIIAGSIYTIKYGVANNTLFINVNGSTVTGNTLPIGYALTKENQNLTYWYIGREQAYTTGIFNIYYLELPDGSVYNFSSGLANNIINRLNGDTLAVAGYTTDFWGLDLTLPPSTADNGMSIISGYDGEIPPSLSNPLVDCVDENPLTNPATSKIVSNVDGYIILPDDILINVGTEEDKDLVPLFDRSNSALYTSDANENAIDWLGIGYEYYWRIDKLNTANILSWMQPDYKFSWFVKNTFTEGTFDPITIKEIMAYNAPITGADNLSKLMKYLGIDVWIDSQTYDDNETWFD